MQFGKLPIALTCGVIAGLALIVLTTILYLGGVSTFLGSAAYLGYVILIALAVVGAQAEKKAHAGFLEFREALKVCFLVFVIALLLQTIYSYILMNYINVNFRQAVEKEVLNRTEKLLRNFGLPQDKIDETLAKESGKNQYTPGKILQGLMISYIVSFLVALVIAAIVKKKRPPFEDAQF